MPPSYIQRGCRSNGASSSRGIAAPRRKGARHPTCRTLLADCHAHGQAGISWLAAPSAARASTDVLRPLTPTEAAAVDKALKSAVPKSKAAVVLRLVFHDAGTFSAASGDGGANASIQFELGRPENFGLKRGWRAIQQAADALKKSPAAELSYADLITLAGAYSVSLCKGPRIPVLVGRQDAVGPDPEGRLPAETLSAPQLKQVFAEKGFTTREFLVLSGAHTIGGKGFGDPTTFDNAYYQALLKKPWLDPKDPMASMIGLPSDQVLPDDPDLLPLIQEYADDQARFFDDFTAAYIKLTGLGV